MSAGDRKTADAATARIVARVEVARSDANCLLAIAEGSTFLETLTYLKAHPPSPLVIAMLIRQAPAMQEIAHSLETSERLNNAKHAPSREAKQSVQAAWSSRSDAGQSKAAFAREQVHFVKRKHGVAITAARIAEHWLKGL